MARELERQSQLLREEMVEQGVETDEVKHEGTYEETRDLAAIALAEGGSLLASIEAMLARDTRRGALDPGPDVAIMGVCQTVARAAAGIAQEAQEAQTTVHLEAVSARLDLSMSGTVEPVQALLLRARVHSRSAMLGASACSVESD
jgi:hypothetical protein